MREEVRLLRQENARLHRTIRSLRSENADLKQEVFTLKDLVKDQSQEIDVLSQTVAELELNMRVYQGMIFKKSGGTDTGITSGGQLIESDGTKKRGGQPGHKGISRKSPKYVDKVVEVKASVCPDCGGKLKPPGSYDRHLVEDIPPLRETHVQTTEYRKCRQWCPSCKKLITSNPEGIIPNSRFGVNLTILILLLKYVAKISLGNITRILHDIYGLEIQESTVQNHLSLTRDFLGSAYENLLEEVRGSPVKFADETGWNIDGDRGWAWAFLTDRLVCYLIEKTRGKGVARRVLSASASDSVLVSDDYAVYSDLGLDRQSCWSHILRQARDLSEMTGSSSEVRALKSELFSMFSQLSEIVNGEFKLKDREQEYSRYYGKLQEMICRDYEKIPDAARVQKRICNQIDHLLTAVVRKGVPLTNNHAERQIRKMVMCRKVSGGSRSEEGAQIQAVNMSVIQSFMMDGQELVPSLFNLLQTDR